MRAAVVIAIVTFASSFSWADNEAELAKLVCQDHLNRHKEKNDALEAKRTEAKNLKGPAASDTVAPYKTNADKITTIAEEANTIAIELNNLKTACVEACKDAKGMNATVCSKQIDLVANKSQFLEERKKTCGEAQAAVPPRACAMYEKAAPGAQNTLSSFKEGMTIPDKQSYQKLAEAEAQNLTASFGLCKMQQQACDSLCGEVGADKAKCTRIKDTQYEGTTGMLKNTGLRARSEVCGALGSSDESCDMSKYMAGVQTKASAMDYSRPFGMTGMGTSAAFGTGTALTPAEVNAAPVNTGSLLANQTVVAPGLSVVDLPPTAPADTTTGWGNTTTTFGDGNRISGAAPVVGSSVPRVEAPPRVEPPRVTSPGGDLTGGNRQAAGTANDSTGNMMKNLAANPAFGQMIASAAAVQPKPDTSALAQAQAMLTDICATDPTGQACTCKLDPSRCEASQAPKVNQGEEVAKGGGTKEMSPEELEKKRAEIAAAFASLTSSTAVQPGDAARVGLSGYVPDPKDPKDKKTAALGGAKGSTSGDGGSGTGPLGYMRGTNAAAMARAKAAAQYGSGGPKAGAQVADAPEEKLDFNRFLPRSFGLARRRIAGVQGNGEIGGKFENLFENVNRAYRNNGPQLSPTTAADQKW